MNIAINDITAEAFAQLAGGSIGLLRDGAPPVPLRLCEVKLLGAGGPRTAPPFSATLCAPAGARLAQGIHALQHPTLGRLDLFLVPIGNLPEGAGYEVVFN